MTTSSQDAVKYKSSDQRWLARLVKEAQKLGLEGYQGQWAAYLEANKMSDRDPARHKVETLAAFITTLGDKLPQRMLERHRGWDAAVSQEKAMDKRPPWDPMCKLSPGTEPTWQLVCSTAKHSRFSRSYTFPSYSKGWIRPPRRAVDCSQTPVLLGLDCEMCATSDNQSELVAYCLVNASGQVVQEIMVKPKKKIVDYRTHITGLTNESFQDVTARRKDAQAALLKALAAGNVVLVGHALSHDLNALRLDYQPVIDTSMLFSYRGLPDSTPSLAHLTEAVLKRRLRKEGELHNCREDAVAALQLVLHELEHGRTPQLVPPTDKVPKEDLAKLLVHSIPPNTTLDDLRALFPAPMPQFLSTSGSIESKKVFLLFKHAGAANAAFKQLQGKAEKDALGRAQRVVQLVSGANAKREVRVRKMGVGSGGQAFGFTVKNPARRGKRQRSEPANGEHPSKLAYSAATNGKMIAISRAAAEKITEHSEMSEHREQEQDEVRAKPCQAEGQQDQQTAAQRAIVGDQDGKMRKKKKKRRERVEQADALET